MSSTSSSLEKANNPANSVIVRPKLGASAVLQKIGWLFFTVVLWLSYRRFIFHPAQPLRYVVETGILVIAILPIVIPRKPLVINDVGLVYGGETFQWDRIKQFETVPWTRGTPPGTEVTLFQMSIFGMHRRFVIPNQFELKTSELTELMQQRHLRAFESLRSAESVSKCRNGG